METVSWLLYVTIMIIFMMNDYMLLDIRVESSHVFGVLADNSAPPSTKKIITMRESKLRSNETTQKHTCVHTHVVFISFYTYICICALFFT